MDRVISERLRLEDFDDLLAVLRAPVEADRRARRLRRGLIGGATGALIVLIASVPSATILWIFAYLGALFFALSARAAYRRREEKHAFTEGVLQALRDELHPRGRHRVQFDPRDFERADKLASTGRTASGRPKARFIDKWLSLDLVLADGSRLSLRTQTSIKQKRGSVVGEKRRLFLGLAPARRWDPAGIEAHLRRLRRRLKAVGRRHTGREEALHAHVHLVDRVIQVRLSQLDAQLSVAEVEDLIATLIGYVIEHPRAPAAPAP